jgi:hypothetical protein
VSRFYTIDAANERLPDVRAVLERLRDERRALVELRDEAATRVEALRGAGVAGRAAETEPDAADLERWFREDPDLRAIRLRMQGLVDQMQAAVTELVDWDVTLRDIETGLVDFPALASGRQIWLCWRLGEGSIEWWHELDEGFAGRERLTDLT